MRSLDLVDKNRLERMRMNISHGRRKGPSFKKLLVATYSVLHGSRHTGWQKELEEPNNNMMIHDPIDEGTFSCKVRVKTNSTVV